MYEVIIGTCKFNLNLNVGPLFGCEVYSFETEEEADAAIAAKQAWLAAYEIEAKRRPDQHKPDCGKFLLVKKLY
jgi:hypothetical protein